MGRMEKNNLAIERNRKKLVESDRGKKGEGRIHLAEPWPIKKKKRCKKKKRNFPKSLRNLRKPKRALKQQQRGAHFRGELKGRGKEVPLH